MHANCWDSDIPDEVYTYIHEAQSNGLCGFCVYCTVCINFVDKLREFDKQLRAVETSLVQNSPHAQTYAAIVIGTQSTPQSINSQQVLEFIMKLQRLWNKKKGNVT